MKKIIFLSIAVAMIALYVLSPFLQGWAYQNSFDRQQYRAQAQADWSLSYDERRLKLDEREAISSAVVAGKTFGLWMFWLLVGFFCVMVMAFMAGVFFKFMQPKPVYTPAYRSSGRYLQTQSQYKQIAADDRLEIIQYANAETEYAER